MTRLVPLGTRAELPVKDVMFKEKLQSLLRIEPGARRLNLKNGTQGRQVNAKLVGSGTTRHSIAFFRFRQDP